MKTNFKIMAILVLSALAAGIAATDALCLVTDKIVAVVNGEVITQRELTRVLISMYDLYKGEYTGARLENKMMEAETEALNQLIDDKLVLSEAKRQGIEATDKEIEFRLHTIKDRFETEEEFRRAMGEQNLSLNELRERMKNDIIKSKLVRREVGQKIVITPGEVRKYYNDHIADYMEPERVEVLNIAIKKEQLRSDREAKFLIEKIRSLTLEGTDFKELATEYSEGPNAKEGGSLGLVEKGKMMEEADSAIFSLKEGEVSDVIESPLGYHIFKVTKKIPAKIISFGAAQYEVEDLIYQMRIENELKQLLKKLRRNAYISIK